METQVNLILTGVFDRIKEAFFNPSIKYIVLEGGTSSSKTYSVLQFLDELCLARRRPLLVSVMSESFPHLRMGCIRDYKKILGAGWDDARWNSTNSVYAYRPGVELEFFSADQPGKVSGPRRDVLYCNEINNIPMEIIRDQASPRTLYKEIYDFNPTHEFWIHEMKGRKDVAWIHSTYLDARHALPKSLIEKIEARRELDPNWWRVYGLGLVGKLEGLVHSNFTQVDEFPDVNLLHGVEGFGLDFGFSADPACLVRNFITPEGHLYSEELFYECEMLPSHIIKRMKDLGVEEHKDVIYADSARPEAIREISLAGYNIKPASKPAGSVEDGIDLVNSYHQHWVKTSVNCIKEQRNYRFITDKNGHFTRSPIDSWNHGMDGRRYFVYMAIKDNLVKGGNFATHRQGTFARR